MLLRQTVLIGVSALVACLIPGQARAETFNTCAGFIDTVPATITTQGVWCLRRDLSTAITSGAAISINANNVTIDCNGFRIGGLAAGAGSQTSGIRAASRQNASVRNCGIRGFLRGIDIQGGAGHLVQDNRLDNNLAIGILGTGDNTVIQRNRVYDTGGALHPFLIDIYSFYVTFGIYAGGADVNDNIIDGLISPTYSLGTGEGYLATGITTQESAGSAIRNNSVRNFDVSNITPTGAKIVYGILTLTATGGDSVAARVSGNQVSSETLVDNSVAVSSAGIASRGNCIDNTVASFQPAYFSAQCQSGPGNLPVATINAANGKTGRSALDF